MPSTQVSRPGALLSVGVLLLMVLGSLVAPAHATDADGPPTSTGVGITPALVAVDLAGREFDFEVSVFNDTLRPRVINMALLDLGHDLYGAPILGEAVSELELAGESRFELAPGESRTLSLVARFPNSVGLYAAVVAQVEPDDPGRAVGARTQVASVLLLRGPRPWDQSLQQRDVGILEDADGTQVVYADVSNVGDAHIRPTSTIRVRQDGQVVEEVELPGDLIIPGYARRLTAPIDLEGLDGPVELELDFGTGFGPPTTVDLVDLPAASSDDVPNGEGGGATLEQPPESSTSVDGDRRVLLPLAGLLILLALGALWLMLMWKRRQDEEEDDDAEETAKASAGVSGTGDDSG